MTTRHAQPGERISQRLVPVGIGKPVFDQSAMPDEADFSRCCPRPGAGGVFERGTSALAYRAEDLSQIRARFAPEERVSAQPLIGRFDRARLQGGLLIAEARKRG